MSTQARDATSSVSDAAFAVAGSYITGLSVIHKPPTSTTSGGTGGGTGGSGGSGGSGGGSTGGSGGSGSGSGGSTPHIFHDHPSALSPENLVEVLASSLQVSIPEAYQALSAYLRVAQRVGDQALDFARKKYRDLE